MELGIDTRVLQEVFRLQRNLNWSTSFQKEASLPTLVRQIANSLVTPGRMGMVRTTEKLWQFVSEARQAQQLLLHAGHRELGDQLSTFLSKFEDDQAVEAFATGLYMHVEELRRERTSLTTNVSRVRRISEWLMDQTQGKPFELGQMGIQDNDQANKWLIDVFDAYLKDNLKLEKFAASYRGAWMQEGLRTIEAKASDFSYDMLLDQKRLITEKPQPTLRRHQMEQLQMFESMAFPGVRKEVAGVGTRADFVSSANVEMDLKAGQRGLEARFTLPDLSVQRTPELQIKVMQFVSKRFPEQEFSIYAVKAPRPGIGVASSGASAEAFGKAAFEVLRMLNEECS